MADFFQEYFINPILYQDLYPPYNPYNTIAYAVIALLAVFLIYKGLQKAGFRIDGRFIDAILPFVVFGGLFRVLEDAKILPRIVDIGGMQVYPFVTPQIYVVIFLLLALIALAAWLLTKDKQKMLEWVGKAGWALSAASVLGLLLHVKNPIYAVAPIALALVIAYAYMTLRKHEQADENRLLAIMVFGQALDGAATFVGISFAGYVEQHVVGNVLLDVGGPLLFFAVKIAFAVMAAEVLRREPDENARHFVMLLITIFGLAPGLRDLTRAALGV